MESVLAGLSADPTWTEEKTAILNWLAQNPAQKSMYVFDVNTGIEPYQVAMGRVSGNNYTAHLPAVDNQGRVLTYWRSKRSTLFRDTGTFGTSYCPDVSFMDMNTGDRVKIILPATGKVACPELDNGFQLTVGGNYLYMHNHFRGSKVINLVTGSNRGIAAPWACWDGACWRGSNFDGDWGFQIIYYGNDSDGVFPTRDPRPYTEYQNSVGFAGIVPASINGTNMLFINEAYGYAIVGIRHKP
jgi:hypothetical protein